MDHQIAEFKHECGTIHVYGKGMVVTSPDGACEHVFLGEDFAANLELFDVFLKLEPEGLVNRFGGPVRAENDEDVGQVFAIQHVGGNEFFFGGSFFGSTFEEIIADDEDESGGVMVVNRDFLEFLRTCTIQLTECNEFEYGEICETWTIEGSFPGSDLAFSINPDGFEFYARDENGNSYVFSTDREDQELWDNSFRMAREMLDREVVSGWQIVSADTTVKRMRLEKVGENITFSLLDPEADMPSFEIGFDRAEIEAVDGMLSKVWPDESQIIMSLFFAAGDEDEDDGDED